MLQPQIDVQLEKLNSFGIVAKARCLVPIRSVVDVQTLVAIPAYAAMPKFVLGGGSNLVLTSDVQSLILKVEIRGLRLLRETDKYFLVEAGGGENWHDFVAWTLQQQFFGLENLALIPGTVGAAPVQNIGAYGLELQDYFDSLDYVDLVTGHLYTLEAAACHFGYRDSIFKHELRNHALITHVRFALPKAWRPDIGYADLARQAKRVGQLNPTPQIIFDWVCQIRRAKLPDPQVWGNTGSFFKNPIVTAEQCKDILAREPQVVHYPLLDGRFKLAAAWLIEACGWKGRGVGHAGVHPQHALVLINKGRGTGISATGGEVMLLARSIQTSVYERFGIRLEIEPVVL